MKRNDLDRLVISRGVNLFVKKLAELEEGIDYKNPRKIREWFLDNTGNMKNYVLSVLKKIHYTPSNSLEEKRIKQRDMRYIANAVPRYVNYLKRKR